VLRWIFIGVFAAALTPRSNAQLMALSGPIPPESVGLPPPAPLLTSLGMLDPGKFATDPSIALKGAVLEVFHEELRGIATPAGPAGEVEASVRTKFDEQGHVIEKIEKRWGSQTETIYGYQDRRLVSMESTYPHAKKPVPKSWSYWTYNNQGKLIEYRRGRGATIENHELGFQYDTKGRLFSFEYRQGANDMPFSRTEISYSADGKTVIATKRYLGTKIIDRTTSTLDDHGRVIRLVPESEGRPMPEQAGSVVFRYDDKGRLAEQITDARKFGGPGSEFDLPPGTISITYDDRIHTKTTKYSFPNEGPVEVVVTQDDSGATLGYTLVGAGQHASMKLDCAYDRFGNWTSCQQVADHNGQEYIKEGFRRTIMYR
jgi:hypothetical protein